MKPDEKVVSMQGFRSQADNKDVSYLEQLNIKTSQDISRMALVIALLAVLVAGVLFFKANQSIDAVTTTVASLDTRMGELENLPAKSKKMVLNTIIMEMAQKASFLSTQVENKEQAAKLVQAMELLNQARPE